MIIRFLVSGGVVLAILACVVAPAQVTPQAIKLQGFLSDNQGGESVPVDGPFSMTFDLYDSDFGGALISTVGPYSVNVVDGLYSVELPFPVSAFDGSDRYIEITVDGEVLAPRIHLASSPFAYVAENSSLIVHEADPDAHPNLMRNTGGEMTGDLSLAAADLEVAGGGAIRVVDSQSSSRVLELSWYTTGSERYPRLSCEGFEPCQVGIESKTLGGSAALRIESGAIGHDGTDVMTIDPDGTENVVIEIDRSPEPQAEDGSDVGEVGSYIQFDMPDGPDRVGMTIRQGASSNSALDIVGSGSHKMMRCFFLEDPFDDRPGTWINDSGAIMSWARMLISGHKNGLYGDQFNILWPSDDAPMAAFWGDINGPTIVVRPNSGGAGTQSYNAAFLGRYGVCAEDRVTECLLDEQCQEECVGRYRAGIMDDGGWAFGDSTLGWGDGGACSGDSSIECAEDWQCPIDETCAIDGRNVFPPFDVHLNRSEPDVLELLDQFHARPDDRILRDLNLPAAGEPLAAFRGSAVFRYHDGDLGGHPISGADVWGGAGGGSGTTWPSVQGVRARAVLRGDGNAGTVPALSGVDAQMRYGLTDVGSDYTVGTGAAFRVRTPDAPGTGVTVGGNYGVYIEDLQCADYADCAGIHVSSQGGTTDGTHVGLELAGGDWNTGSLRIGDTFLWVQPANGHLRYATDAPSDSGDGARVYNALETDEHWGHVLWTDGSTGEVNTGNKLCGRRGLECRHVREVDSNAPRPCSATILDLSMAFCGGSAD